MQIKKCFVLTQFGSPHPWTEQYFNNVKALEKYGYYWKIFTPNKLGKTPSNVEVVPMTIEQFDALIEKKTGVHPHNYLENGVPHKAVSDFYVATGRIFEDYLKEFDFWGITNWDIVYGRLPMFIPDQILEEADIFSDDVRAINGIFSLFRNTDEMNDLFKEISLWQTKFTIHQLFGLDEYDMTDVVIKNSEKIRFLHPQYYPLHSHDRLKQHQPNVKLEIKEDGSLWELFEDIGHPEWIHARPFIGREIPYFHFIRTKKWPEMSSSVRVS